MKRSILTIIIALLATAVGFAQSSDLRAYGLLKGKVKRIATNDNEGVAFDTAQISYTKFDSHGNWTKCVWTGTMKESDDGGSTYRNIRYNRTIIRQIFYY